MRKALTVASIALAASLLGGCAGGGLAGGSFLPTAGSHTAHPLDSVGFGPVPTHMHRRHVAGLRALPEPEMQKLDSVGFGPVP